MPMIDIDSLANALADECRRRVEATRTAKDLAKVPRCGQSRSALLSQRAALRRKLSELRMELSAVTEELQNDRSELLEAWRLAVDEEKSSIEAIRLLVNPALRARGEAMVRAQYRRMMGDQAGSEANGAATEGVDTLSKR